MPGPTGSPGSGLAVLHLAEGSAMRAPGEASGMMALEIAMDEMAEKLNMDPVEFRIKNDTQEDPEKPGRKFSTRKLVECLREGADKFGWERRNAKPGTIRRKGTGSLGWVWPQRCGVRLLPSQLHGYGLTAAA